MSRLADQMDQQAIGYHRRYGRGAWMRIQDDLSRALARQDRADVRRLQQVRLRFERLEWAGQFDLRSDGTTLATAA